MKWDDSAEGTNPEFLTITAYADIAVLPNAFNEINVVRGGGADYLMSLKSQKTHI